MAPNRKLYSGFLFTPGFLGNFLNLWGTGGPAKRGRKEKNGGIADNPYSLGGVTKISGIFLPGKNGGASIFVGGGLSLPLFLGESPFYFWRMAFFLGEYFLLNSWLLGGPLFLITRIKGATHRVCDAAIW